MSRYTDPKWLVAVKGWLKVKLTVEEIEAQQEQKANEFKLPRHPKMPQGPFGWVQPQWDALKARMQPGDELWSYRSPEASWMQLAGRGGYALVRNGEVIDEICTVLN